MSPPLRVPLEVLERILSFTFASPPPSPPPLPLQDGPCPFITPPIGSSSLLLVSKGVRQLSLPLYYQSISICDGSDWKRFLDPQNGLLVGDDNEERRSWVKEIRWNAAEDAWIPLDTGRVIREVEQGQRPSTLLVPLDPVVLPNLELVNFFHWRGWEMATLPPFKYDGDEVWSADLAGKLWWWEDKAEKELRQYEKRRREDYRDDATERFVSSSDDNDDDDNVDSESLNWEQYVTASIYGVMRGYKDLLSKPLKDVATERRKSLSLLLNFSRTLSTLSVRIPLDLFPLFATLGHLPPLMETINLSLVILPHVLVDLSSPRSQPTADYVECEILPYLPTNPRVSDFMIELDEELTRGEVNVSRSLTRWDAARIESRQQSISGATTSEIDVGAAPQPEEGSSGC
ncbi:hypothetical protein BDY24DRAFT_441420 [Mrakia frigida]|uniref:uncharacterized protein n=1 Tax=Mrakia frigida TaxID=29902 RepID=UPI003FCC0512